MSGRKKGSNWKEGQDRATSEAEEAASSTSKKPEDQQHAAPETRPEQEDLLEDEEEMLGQILVYLRTRTGHDVAHYQRTTVLRSVTQRMQNCGADSLGAYLSVLHDDPSELQALLSDLLITVTDFFGTVREPLVVLDTPLQVVLANRSFYDTFGLRPEETQGRRIYELGNNQWNIPRLRELLEDILPTNSVFNDFEVEHTFEQIGRRTMLLNARRIDAKHLILLAIEDITQQKKAEQDLVQEQDLARLYLDVVGVMMVVLDNTGHVTLINRAGCETLGYAEDEVVGRDWFAQFLPERDRESVRRVFDELMAGTTEAALYHENPVLTKSGKERLILWHNAFVRNAQGYVTTVLSSGTDITERRQAEEALQESRARAHAILETTVDAVITINEQGCIESVNPATERIFGYAASEMIGENVKMLMPTPYLEEHDQYLQNYLEMGERKIIGIGREVTAQRQDGTTFPIDLAVSEVHLNQRRIFTGFIRDISERRRLEHEVLRISEEERQRIGQDIHDELASQFSGIALLSRGLVNQWKQEQAVSTEMLEEVAQLARMGAEQARSLAHGLSPVKLEREGMKASLKELAHHAQVLSGIAYTLDVDDELPPLKSNVATQLFRIAQEAVNNALKHAGARHLVLRMRHEGDRLVLTVSDDGVGLPDTPQETGGMGLHIMPYRARMIGATLTIHSAPDKGTTVTCVLPLPAD